MPADVYSLWTRRALHGEGQPRQSVGTGHSGLHLGLPCLGASPGTRPHLLRASWCETRPTPQGGCEGGAMRTYVTAPTMRPAACLVLNTCESFPGLLRELREMKKNAKGWKIATGSEICEWHYDSCLWDKTRTRGTSFGPAEFNFI